jgi:2-keto-4-pentenoate hydratase/2-oxohepta-3-ene-1,7-dioic acid hydratase in catechol pathway
VQFATIVLEGEEVAAVRAAEGAWVPLTRLGEGLPKDLLSLIELSASAEMPAEIVAAAASGAAGGIEAPTFAPLYRRPRKIWGIGLNYREHAVDLDELPPSEPASFIKAEHTIIGAGDAIRIPPQSERTTAEAELGVVIGRTCWQASEAEALDFVFGFCPILDQTAEDILARNPRFLTRSKNFPTFFSFGPHLVTTDEALADRQLAEIEVQTWLNGSAERANTVANMTHGPAALVSFHSWSMPLFPGDVISTGTPGAVVLAPGDVAECRIDGFDPLLNPVAAAGDGVAVVAAG